jgi:hypothetical protein
VGARTKPIAVTDLLVLVGCAAATTVWWAASGRSPEQRSDQIGTRIPELKRLVSEEEDRAPKIVANYIPATSSRIDDLSAPANTLLQQLPGVVDVEVARPVKVPTHRLIHVRDWHFVPRDLYALDMRTAYKGPLSDREIDLLHEELLLEVELVQIEQMMLLRCLIKHHGLRHVFAEGFSVGELQAYKDRIAALRGVEKDDIPRLRQQLVEVRSLLGGIKEGEDRYEKAKNIEAEVLQLLDQHRVALLEVGAAGRLLISGELEEVLPLEDAEKLDEAKPITPSGEVKLNSAKVEARHDAQVWNALKYGPVAVVILGGAHDLTNSASRFSGGGCEYIWVTTKRFREMSGR